MALKLSLSFFSLVHIFDSFSKVNSSSNSSNSHGLVGQGVPSLPRPKLFSDSFYYLSSFPIPLSLLLPKVSPSFSCCRRAKAQLGPESPDPRARTHTHTHTHQLDKFTHMKKGDSTSYRGETDRHARAHRISTAHCCTRTRTSGEGEFKITFSYHRNTTHYCSNRCIVRRARVEQAELFTQRCGSSNTVVTIMAGEGKALDSQHMDGASALDVWSQGSPLRRLWPTSFIKLPHWPLTRGMQPWPSCSCCSSPLTGLLLEVCSPHT